MENKEENKHVNVSVYRKFSQSENRFDIHQLKPTRQQDLLQRDVSLPSNPTFSQKLHGGRSRVPCEVEFHLNGQDLQCHTR